MSSNLRVGIGTGILKRTQRSTEVLPNETRPYKRVRETGEFNPALLEEFSDSSNSMLTRRNPGDDNASGATSQASLHDIPAGLIHPPRQRIESFDNSFPTQKKTLRHSQSSGGLGLRRKHSVTNFRSSRRKSVSGSSSDPADLLGEEDKELAPRGRRRVIDLAGTDLHSRLLPPVAQYLRKRSSTAGPSTRYYAPEADEILKRDGGVRFPTHIGASTSSSYPQNVVPHVGTTVSSSEELSGSRARRSEDKLERHEKPKASHKKILAVEASHVEIPTLDTLVDEDDLPEDLQKEIDASLDPGKQEIADLFSELGLPLSPERIPLGESGKHHTASTVTREILQEHGSWEFDDQPRWKHLHIGGRKKKLDPADVYVPIDLTGDLVGIKEPPTNVTAPNKPDIALHSKIELFLDGIEDYIESTSRKLYLAEEIATEEVRNDRADKELLMPVAYKAIFDKYEREKEKNTEEDRNLTNDEDLSPTSSPMKKSEARSPSDDIPNPVSEPPSIAEQFIEQHQLGRSLEEVLTLREFLRSKEPEHNRRANHQLLCAKTGTAEERRQLKRKGKPRLLSVIEYIPRRDIEERDKKRRAGNAMANEYAEDQNFGAARMVLRWAEFTPLKPPVGTNIPELEERSEGTNGSKKTNELSEADVESHVGGLVKGFFRGHEYLEESANQALRVVRCLQLFGTRPKPDYAARTSGQACEAWGLLLALCLWSGECKPSHKFKPKTEAQLAMNSVAGLIMIIIMHLSTRKSPNQKLLPWMFLYAFVYTEKGITIFAHYPRLVVAEDGKSRWKFKSWKVSETFKSMWAEGANEDLRMRGLAAVYLMRSHTEFVLEQLLAWSQKLPTSAAPIMEMLIARANQEKDLYQEVLRKLYTGVAKRIEA